MVALTSLLDDGCSWVGQPIEHCCCHLAACFYVYRQIDGGHLLDILHCTNPQFSAAAALLGCEIYVVREARASDVGHV